MWKFVKYCLCFVILFCCFLLSYLNFTQREIIKLFTPSHKIDKVWCTTICVYMNAAEFLHITCSLWIHVLIKVTTLQIYFGRRNLLTSMELKIAWFIYTHLNNAIKNVSHPWLLMWYPKVIPFSVSWLKILMDSKFLIQAFKSQKVHTASVDLHF